MKCFFRILFLLFLPHLLFSQVNHKAHVHSSACGGLHQEMTEAQRKELAHKMLEWKHNQHTEGAEARALPVRYTIPVVFHLIEGSPMITDAQVRTALASLNNAYSRSNDYAGGGNFQNTDRGADTEIEFCLAQKAPDGGITSGITRTTSAYTVFDNDLEDGKLKTMLQWDPRHYLNIWVVTSIDSELNPTFSGPTGWTRGSLGGYATLPGAVIRQDAYTDGAVVAGLGTGLVAHEVGHYLGLLHTFSPDMRCDNNDCTVDGDMVCDTPPDRTQGSYGACGGTEDNNSCSTDSLYILPDGTRQADVDDMFNNFMDYGNGGCSNAFTRGQAERMQFHITNYRNELFTQAPSNNTVCTVPCASNVLIEGIQKNIEYPLINTPILFSSTATGVTNYEWYVERLGTIESNYSVAMETGYTPTLPAVATTSNLTHAFPTEGKYRIYLKAWNNTSPACFASSSAIVTVTCGVDARFFPDKRLIASKQSANPRSQYLDSVLFKNRTFNGLTYNWTVEHTLFDPSNGPALPVFNATSTDLNHVFLEPGNYTITLDASNGTCTNTTESFNLTVEDPTMDGAIWLQSVECYKHDSLRTVIRTANFGYDTIHIGTPISFYSGDPSLATTTHLKTFYTTKLVYGYYFAEDFTVVMPLDRVNADNLYAVFNDSGTVIPVVYPSQGEKDKISTTITPPHTGLTELSYRNTSVLKGIQFKLVLPEVTASRCANTTYDFDVRYRNNGNRAPGVKWVPATNLSCTNCFTPTLTLDVTDREQLVILTSEFGCIDTGRVIITVPYDTIATATIDTACQDAPSPKVIAIGNQLKWYTVASGGISSPTTPIPSTATIGVTNFWVSETTNGCEGHRVKVNSVIEGAPLLIVNNPTPLCEGDSIPENYLKNTVSGPGDITWYTTNIGGIGNAEIPEVDSSNTGSFIHWITLTGNNGCITDRKQITYTIKEVPEAPEVGEPIDVCIENNSPNLTSSILSGVDILWYSKADSSIGTSFPPTLLTDSVKTVNYWVTQTVNNCEGPKAKLTYTIVDINIALDSAFTIDEGQSQDLTPLITIQPQDKPYIIEWLDEDGTLFEVSQNATVSPIETTDYTIQISSEYGCVVTDKVYIKVLGLLYPTHIFSPNGDGANDTWYIKNLEDLSDIKVTVFDRWGSLVYTSKDYKNDWNGTFNNQLLPVGTYYYVIDQSGFGRENVAGSITIRY